jgi:type IV secretion system protein VirB4
MVPFHNYPAGRATGNHWGDALALLVTSARSPYYFSLHASDPTDPDGGSRKDTGHTCICGPTGSGKTVFIGFLVATLARRGATQVIFDKDRGLEILVRALGGEYSAAHEAASPRDLIRCNLPHGREHRVSESLAAMRCFVGRAAHGIREEADLDQALRGTLVGPAKRGAYRG